jgi:hypothetical protein
MYFIEVGSKEYKPWFACQSIDMWNIRLDSAYTLVLADAGMDVKHERE